MWCGSLQTRLRSACNSCASELPRRQRRRCDEAEGRHGVKRVAAFLMLALQDAVLRSEGACFYIWGSGRAAQSKHVCT